MIKSMKHILLTILLTFGATTDAAMIKVIDKAWLSTNIWIFENYTGGGNTKTSLVQSARAFKTKAHCFQDLENNFMGLLGIDGIKIEKNKTSYKQLRDGEEVHKLECQLISVLE